jgi:hypothetical protein
MKVYLFFGMKIYQKFGMKIYHLATLTEMDKNGDLSARVRNVEGAPLAHHVAAAGAAHAKKRFRKKQTMSVSAGSRISFVQRAVL